MMAALGTATLFISQRLRPERPLAQIIILLYPHCTTNTEQEAYLTTF